MIDLIKFDLINRFKKPITWFVIIVLCITIGINFLEIEDKRTTRPFVGHNSLGFRDSLTNWDTHMTDKEKEAHPKAYQSYLLVNETFLRGMEVTLGNDYKEINRVNSFINLLMLKMTRLSLDPISDVILKDKIYDIWLEVASDIPYETVDFRPTTTAFSSEEELYLLGAKYYENLYVNNFKPIYNDEVNNSNTIYSYFLKILPLMTFAVIVLFTYNNINKEKNSGVLKLVLTQSISRGKYYFSKWASSVLHILTIIFIPPVFMSIIGGAMGEFVNLKYPVFYLNDAFTRLTPIPNYFDSVEKEFANPTLFRRTFGHIAPVQHSDIVVPHNDIDIIPFYKYIVLVIILVILFVMFIVAFVQLISAIINHEIISLVASVGLIGIFVYLGQSFTQETSYNLNPFTFSNASRIVEGTLNVTFLTSALIMLISTGILLVGGYKYFKKKEI